MGTKVSGVLLHRNFEYLLVAPEDLSLYTPLTSHTLMQVGVFFYQVVMFIFSKLMGST